MHDSGHVPALFFAKLAVGGQAELIVSLIAVYAAARAAPVNENL